MDTIVKRLKKYLDFIGVNVSFAEKEINVSNGTLSKPFSANTTIKTDTLEKFLKKYDDLNPVWLLSGIGDICNSKAESQVIQDSTSKIDQLEQIIVAKNQTISAQAKTIATLEGIISRAEGKRQAG